MKKVLLIGGGGTLGTYTAEELLRLGHSVDIICLEEKTLDNESLTYYKAEATLDYLRDLFSKKHYDGIVNFLHFCNAEEYPPVSRALDKQYRPLNLPFVIPCLR